MIIILESWSWILFNRSFYGKWLRNNFRENVSATFTNSDHKRMLHIILKRKAIWSVCRTINDSKCMMFIKVLLSTHLLRKPGSSEKKRTNNWCRVDLQLSWLKAKWVNSVVASNIFFNELLCVRKTKLLCLETDFHMIYIRKFSISCHSQYEIHIDFAAKDCGLSAHRS